MALKGSNGITGAQMSSMVLESAHWGQKELIGALKGPPGLIGAQKGSLRHTGLTIAHLFSMQEVFRAHLKLSWLTGWRSFYIWEKGLTEAHRGSKWLSKKNLVARA